MDVRQRRPGAVLTSHEGQALGVEAAGSNSTAESNDEIAVRSADRGRILEEIHHEPLRGRPIREGHPSEHERTASKIETYPDASGLYISMAPDKGSLGMVFYDRVKGNLMMASKASGSWVTTILDGEANGADTGDVGIGATLAIDGSGVWHVAYSNGYDESLQYLQVKDGVPAPAEVIDDGVGVEGTPFTDGRHIVGDDASIHVTAGGDIHVSYQDATSGKLHHALGTPSANGHSWAVKVIAQEGFGGAFSKIVDHQGTLKVVNWSRSFGGAYVGDVSVVKP